MTGVMWMNPLMLLLWHLCFSRWIGDEINLLWLKQIIVMTILVTMFMVLLSLWGQCCEISPGSFDEFILSTRWLPTLKPIQPTRHVSPSVGYHHWHLSSPFIIITWPVCWYSFTIPWRLEGWVNLGAALMVYSLCSRLYIATGCHDKHNCYPQWD